MAALVAMLMEGSTSHTTLPDITVDTTWRIADGFVAGGGSVDMKLPAQGHDLVVVAILSGESFCSFYFVFSGFSIGRHVCRHLVHYAGSLLCSVAILSGKSFLRFQICFLFVLYGTTCA